MGYLCLFIHVLFEKTMFYHYFSLFNKNIHEVKNIAIRIVSCHTYRDTYRIVKMCIVTSLISRGTICLCPPPKSITWHPKEKLAPTRLHMLKMQKYDNQLGLDSVEYNLYFCFMPSGTRIISRFTREEIYTGIEGQRGKHNGSSPGETR